MSRPAGCGRACLHQAVSLRREPDALDLDLDLDLDPGCPVPATREDRACYTACIVEQGGKPGGRTQGPPPVSRPTCPDAIPQSSEGERPFANMAAVRVGVHEPESHPQQGDFDMGMGWTSERTDLAKLMRDFDDVAGALYEHAIDALSKDPLLRAPIMVGAHCIRELFSLLAELSPGGRPQRIDTNRATKNLRERWLANSLDLDAAIANDTSQARAIPIDVFRAAQVVARVGGAANENSRSLTARVVTGHPADRDLAPVRRVHMAVEKFRNWVHAVDYSAPNPPLPSRDEIELALGIIEAALRTRFLNRSDSARSVREALAAANARAEGNAP